MPSQGLQAGTALRGPNLAPSFPAPKDEMKAGVKARGTEERRARHSPDLRTGRAKAEPGTWPHPAV